MSDTEPGEASNSTPGGSNAGKAAASGAPGLAYERTELAWNRSGLAVLVVVGILLRRLWPLEGYRSELALALIGFGAGAWALGMTLARRNLAATPEGGLSGVHTFRLLTIGTLVLAAAGLVAGIFPA